MRLAIISLSVAIAGTFLMVAVGDEPAIERVDPKVTPQLLERLVHLERRVAELETRIAPRAPVATPPAAGFVPQYRAVPLPPAGNAQPNPYLQPQTPSLPSGTVPDSWQRFEFNGHYFYIVPAGEAAAKIRTH